MSGRVCVGAGPRAKPFTHSHCMPYYVNRERCITARYTVPAIKMPTFVLNSIHDYWQVMCVLTATPANEGTSETCSATPGWHDCAVAGNFHLSTCSSSQVNRLNA